MEPNQIYVTFDADTFALIFESIRFFTFCVVLWTINSWL